MVTVPAVAGVKTPLLSTVPIVEGLTDHVTELLKLPEPVTVGVQSDVWFVCIDEGEQMTDTAVILGGAFTVTVAEPDLVASCVEVAVMVPIPVAMAVKTPVLLMVPTEAGLTAHVTEEL